MRNVDVARAFLDLAAYLEMHGVPFKPRAYEKAAHVIEALPQGLAELHRRGGERALRDLPGIGSSMAAKIVELLSTGKMAALEEHRRRIPVDIAGLTALEGVGPKAVRVLYEQLGVRTLDDLGAAARAGRIRALPHFGERSEQRILRALTFAERNTGRRPIGEVRTIVDPIVAALRAMRGVVEVAVAGSLRRCKDTIGDADLLVTGARPPALIEAFTRLPDVITVLDRGPTKARVRVTGGLQVDVRAVPRACFGAALLYFTGSKAHNVKLRQMAIARGLKLSEYGLFRGSRRVAGATEADCYTSLGLPWIPPELREDAGEIEAARAGTLPDLIEPGDLRGDLQIQTDWTDGADSIEAMALAARGLGLEYIAITDHTRGLAMTGGSDEVALRRQMQAIARLNSKLRGIRVLSGAEVNIDREGALDIDDATLARLDVVGIAVHSHFGLSRSEQTRRIIRAMQNPHADILFHPTGRLLGKRPAFEVDMDAIIAAAAATGTVLELDAYPERLDLHDEHLRRAITAGVPLVIDTDAHAVTHLGFARDYGIGQARRGWVTARDVLNTRPVGSFLAALKDGRKSGAQARSRRTVRARSAAR